MKAHDFEYDGVRLSDFGMLLCKFDDSGMETTELPAISFNTVPTLNGNRYELTGSKYEDCLTTTLQICKNPCNGDAMAFTTYEIRNIMSWLNRRGFHKFKLLEDEYTGIYFEASFNVNKIEIGGIVYGLELDMTTNSPFARQEPVTMVINNDKANVVRSFYSKSDEEGFIYPDMEITVKSAGDLVIKSITENRTMRIKNCKAGEVITIDYPLIKSSLSAHKIQNDFNWVYYRVSTLFKDKSNEFTASLPCIIKMTYSPIVKVGI